MLREKRSEAWQSDLDCFSRQGGIAKSTYDFARPKAVAICSRLFHYVMNKNNSKNSGFSLVEVILAGSIFLMLALILIGSLIYGQESSLKAGQRNRAVLLAEEGLEAARSIGNSGFTNLEIGSYGLATTTGQWKLVAGPEIIENFSRSLTISVIDDHHKEIVSKVIWNSANGAENNVSLIVQLSDWRSILTATDSSFCASP